MSSNETWAGMIALNLTYTVFCEPCERSIEIDLEAMPPDGKVIGAKFRCGHCNRVGRSIVGHRGALRAAPSCRPNS